MVRIDEDAAVPLQTLPAVSAKLSRQRRGAVFSSKKSAMSSLGPLSGSGAFCGRASGLACSLAAAAFLSSASVARADQAPFWAGKQIVYTVGIGAGDTYDSYARTLAPHLAAHLPGNPSIEVVNKPGAGSMTAVNVMYNVSPRDGTAIVTSHGVVPMMPLLHMAGPQFDPLKMNYIGSMNKDVGVCVVRTDAGVRTVDDARKTQLIFGTTGAGAELTNFTNTLTRMLNLKFKLVTGYSDSAAIDLAIERGELQGRCGVSYSSFKRTHADWLTSGKAVLFLQLGLDRLRDLPNTPALGELVSGENLAALKILLASAVMARPVLAPPDLPADRLRDLQAAFDAAVRDPEYLADANRAHLDVDPTSGPQIAQMMQGLYQSPPEVLNLARSLVGGTN